MKKQDFTIFLIITVIETILFNNAVFAADLFMAGFWGFLLIRNLRKIYIVDKWTRIILAATKKKD
ncbi:DUF3272 family protein [Streptococcus macacae]|uniref:PF11676 family protein n=1 Tax=Streptococcus macacae NCTC 11558 TaxID=764298 RepID=G5JWN0_9STRE|nr:DUF3272 family protein [Streptococcus macacae]EHJ52850.1 hypothetical protein STRMA_1001 [Streptococcus macacae NCTC 11558]